MHSVMLKFFFVILALFVIFVAFKLVLEFRRQRKAIRRCEKADVVEGEWDGQSCLIAFVDEKIINSTTLKIRDNNDGKIRVGDAVYGDGISELVTVTSITDANNIVLSAPQTIQNGTILFFGISVTDAETGTNKFYEDKDFHELLSWYSMLYYT